MANLTLNSGTIKYPAGKEFSSKHTNSPDRINIVVTLANGEEATVWGDVGGSLMLYKKGEPIQLAFDGKNYKVVEEQATQPVPLPSTQAPEVAEAAWDAKMELCATRYSKAIIQAKATPCGYLEERAYHHLRMSAESFDDPVGKQLVQVIALSLYIETNKR
jgi:hypothetical protein